MWPVRRYLSNRGRQAETHEDGHRQTTAATGLLLEAIAREALGSPNAARQALEHALGLAGPSGGQFPSPVRARHGQHRLPESLTQGEARILRYLPTHLSAREIAAELYVSMNTVKTHQRHLYAKLDAHSRTQAVERARALGLLVSP